MLAYFSYLSLVDAGLLCLLVFGFFFFSERLAHRLGFNIVGTEILHSAQRLMTRNSPMFSFTG